jgi:hypothetical protein
MKRITLLIFLLLSLGVYGQAQGPGGGGPGPQSQPVVSSASDPSSCALGKLYINTNSPGKLWARIAGGCVRVDGVGAVAVETDPVVKAIVGIVKSNGSTIAAAGASDLPSAIDAAKVADGSVSNAEYQRLDGVSSGIQSQIDSKQPLNANLTTIAGLGAPTTNDFMVGVASAWARQTVAQVKSTLSLNNVDNTSDANKPVSTAQATTIALKLAIANNLSDLNNAGTARTNLGGTTVGQNYFTLTNPSAISFVKINADNSLTAESAPTHRTSIGGTTAGQNLFTLTNPSAISFLQINADNSVTAQSAAAQKTALSLNNVENTALSTWAGSANVTTLGTIGTGVWQGTVINSTYGGMGVNNAGRTLTLNTNSGTVAFGAASKTFTINKTLTLDGTDGTTMTFPSTSATIARTDAANTFNGNQTITAAIPNLSVKDSGGTVATIVCNSGNASVFGANRTCAGTNVDVGKATAYILMSTASADGNMGFYTTDTNNVDPTNRFSIAKTGILTLNTTNYNTCTGLTTTAAVLGCTVSDERVKNSITPFAGNGLAIVRKIQPITFRFNKGTVWFKDRQELGLSAQNLKAANPLLASSTGTGENLLQPEPMALHAVEIDAIKTLDAQVQRLTRIVKSQQQQIRAFRKRRSLDR